MTHNYVQIQRFLPQLLPLRIRSDVDVQDHQLSGGHS